MRRAPSPADASRRASGTARMASSDTEATSGMVRMPTPMPAASMLPPRPFSSPNRLPTMFGAIHARAKKPRTTDGTPASTSRMGLRKERTRGRANSDRYTAAPSPSGTATIMATPVTIRLLTISGRMPKLFWRGFHVSLVRTSPQPAFEMNSHPLPNSEITMAALTTTDSTAAAKNTSADRPFATVPPRVTGQVELRRASGRDGGGGHACLTRGVDVGGGGPGRATRPPGLRSVWRPSSRSPAQRPSQAAVVALSWSSGSGT